MQAIADVVLRAGRGPEDLEQLTDVWRDAVEATHHFLPVAVIDRLEPKVRDCYLSRLDIQVAERNGCIVGFIGPDGAKVAMLYVADAVRGTGIGSALLHWAQQRFPVLTLDVNEQNPRAVVFYIMRGFVTAGRSPLDADGLPYPLIHLAWHCDGLLPA